MRLSILAGAVGGLTLFVSLVQAASAQQASTFQQSCDQVRYEMQNGQAGISADCRRKDGSVMATHLPLLGIDNTDGDLTHTAGGNPATFGATCRNMEVLQGGPSAIMLAGDCQRRDGSWVGTSTQIWDVENNDGVLQYYWAPRG